MFSSSAEPGTRIVHVFLHGILLYLTWNRTGKHKEDLHYCPYSSHHEPEILSQTSQEILMLSQQIFEKSLAQFFISEPKQKISECNAAFRIVHFFLQGILLYLTWNRNGKHQEDHHYCHYSSHHEPEILSPITFRV